MNRSGFRMSLIASMLLGTHAIAAADKVEVSGVLEDVYVQAVNRSTRTENRDSFTTSAMRTTTGLALSPKETPQSVSVITKTQIEGQGITRLEDALKATTGVTVVRDSDRSRFMSRGFYIDQIEEDGVSSNVSSYVGETILNAESQTDLSVYDHIEVVRGATGLTQANGEPGGTINAVRKRPTSARQIQGSVSAGRFDTYRGELDVSGSLNSSHTVRGRLLGAWEKSGSFIDRVNSRQNVVYGVLDFDLGEKAVWTVGSLYQNRHAVPDVYGLPAGSEDHPLHLPRNAYSGAPWNNSRFTKFNLFSELRYDFNDNWRAIGLVDYRRDTAFREYAALSSGPSWQNSSGTIWGSGNRLADNKTAQWTAQGKLAGRFEVLGRQHDVFATYSYNKRRTDSETMQHWNLWADPSDSWNQFCASRGWPNWCDPNLSRDFPLDPFDGSVIPRPDWSKLADLDYRFNPIHRHTDEHTRSHAVSAGIRFNPTDKLHLLAGFRYTRWRYRQNTDDIIDPANPAPLESMTRRINRNRFVPYLGITWDVTPHHSLYASYTSIFKPQLEYKDAGGNDLPPVIGTNYEIGWKSAWNNKRLNTAVALFQIDQKNRAVYGGDDGMGNGYYINTGRVVSRGLDAEISGNLTDNWKLFAGYTYNDSKYRNDDEDYQAGQRYSQHTPRSIFRLYTNYRLPGAAHRWSIGAGMSVQSRTGNLYDQPNLKQGGYTLWHADVQYAPTDRIRLSLIGNNLSDKRYFENNANRSNGAYNFYGMPRNIMFKLNWRL